MAVTTDKYLDLLEQKKAFAHIATLMPDGSPQVTPVWFDYTNGIVRVNTAKGRAKARNLKPGAPVALAIMDPDNPYRYVQVRGKVRSVTEEGADAHINSPGQEVSRAGQVSLRPARRSASARRDRAGLHLGNGVSASAAAR